MSVDKDTLRSLCAIQNEIVKYLSHEDEPFYTYWADKEQSLINAYAYITLACSELSKAVKA